MPQHRSTRRTAAIAVAGLCLATLPVVSAGVAQAAPVGPGAVNGFRPSVANTDQFTMAAKESGTGKSLCLDADANASAGAHVNTVYCNTSSYQRWQIGTVGTESIWINVGHPGYALAASSLAAGAAMVLKKINGSDATQSFQYLGLPSDNFVIESTRSPSLVLDGVYKSGAAKNGRQVQLATDSGAFSNQAWHDQHFA